MSLWVAFIGPCVLQRTHTRDKALRVQASALRPALLSQVWRGRWLHFGSDLHKLMPALIHYCSHSTGSYVKGTQKALEVCSGLRWSTWHSFATKRRKEELLLFSESNTILAEILSR